MSCWCWCKRSALGAQGFWWYLKNHQVHTMSCFGSNPPSPPRFCLGNIGPATQTLTPSGGVAPLRENAPECSAWHSLAHVLGIPNPTTHGLQGI